MSLTTLIALKLLIASPGCAGATTAFEPPEAFAELPNAAALREGHRSAKVDRKAFVAALFASHDAKELLEAARVDDGAAAATILDLVLTEANLTIEHRLYAVSRLGQHAGGRELAVVFERAGALAAALHPDDATLQNVRATDLRRAAIDAAADLGAKSRSLLLAALEDEDAIVVLHAVRGLARAEPDAVRPQIDAAVARLSDPDRAAARRMMER